MMSSVRVAVGVNDFVDAATAAMGRSRISAAPVLDDTGRLVGLVSASHLELASLEAELRPVRAFFAPIGRRGCPTVGEVMSSPAVSLTPGADLSQVPLCSSGWLGGCWPGGPTRRSAWAGCEGWIGGEGQRGVGRAGRGRQALRRHRRRRRRRHLLTPGGRLIHRVARPVGLRQGTTWQCWPVCSRPTGAKSSSTAPRCSPSRPRGAPVSLVFQKPRCSRI